MSELKRLDKNFALELMSVPTVSSFEMRLVTFIMLWAKKNNVNFQVDNYGNVYLTKGEIKEGEEFYPCLTAHLDSVQDQHMPYIKEGILLEVKERQGKDGKTEWYGDGYGLGGDDKCGVLIALSLFQYVDKLKVAFFLEEEIGCRGSSNMDKSFFDNVGYVIGFDSPDLNRSAWACSGTMLFTKDFYQNHIKEVCDKHNRTKFYSEPFTDVQKIRASLDLMCMNFGSGYYNAHAKTEYVVLEDIDDSIDLAYDLINHLGNVRYEFEKNVSSYSYGGYAYNKESGKYEEQKTKYKDDIDFLKTLGDAKKYSSYGYGSYGSYGGGSRSYGAYGNYWGDEYDDDYDDYAFNRKSSKKVKENLITDEEVISYILDKYDERLNQIKENVKRQCEMLNIDFDKNFGEFFEEEICF